MCRSVPSPSPSVLRLLVVDDRLLVRQAMRALFRPDASLHCDCCGGDQAAARAAETAADVVLLDAAPPTGVLGRRIESIRAARPNAAVVLLGDGVTPARLRAARAAGAFGYWTREVSFDRLREALGAAAAGCRAFCPSAKACCSGDDPPAHDPPAHDPPAHDPPPTGPTAATLACLTRREREVLLLLAAGFTVPEIADRLDLARSTVDNHKARLMKKLRLHRLAHLVRFAVREGLVEA
jgi:DNA-binding NarL/FixJ family response regulator